MGRAIRIEFTGALYHVTSRGDRREDIYEDDADRRRFLELLGYVCETYNWVCHSYCLMSNHYHLVVETVEGNLSKGMRHLNGLYSQTYNRRHQKVGHVFQGRYKAILVEKESYLLELCRYVELNPVRAHMVHRAGDWPWSSYQAMAGDVTSPSWLATDFILSYFAAKKGVAIKAYIKFVGEGKDQPSPWENLRNQIFLGNDEFVEASMAKLDCQEHLFAELHPLKRRMPKPLEYYQQQNSTRDKAIVEAYQSGGYTMKEIGKYFGLGESMISRLLKNSRFKS